jgi:hypothetical protein
MIKMELTKDQIERLASLVKVAKSKGDKIVAVTDTFDAYCPIWGISFPDYKKEKQNMRDSSIDAVPREIVDEVVHDVVGDEKDWAREYSDPDNLVLASFYGSWITLNGEEVTSDEVGVDSGRCDMYGIYYEHLNLPEEVKPGVDPFETEAKKWQAILGE